MLSVKMSRVQLVGTVLPITENESEREQCPRPIRKRTGLWVPEGTSAPHLGDNVQKYLLILLFCGVPKSLFLILVLF